MTVEEFRIYLDENNQNLADEIENVVPLIFTETNGDSYGCQVHKEKNGTPISAEIFYKDGKEQPKIAHELLHAKVSLRYGDNACMFYITRQCAAYTTMIGQIAERIVNLREHLTFFQTYVQMGYQGSQFFEEMPDIHYINEMVNNAKIVQTDRTGRYSVEDFIKLAEPMFMLILYPDIALFGHQIRDLKHINRDFYDMTKELRGTCLSISNNIDHAPSNTLYNAYHRFAVRLNDWMARKIRL